jgi:hypothetical protein
MWRHAVDSKYCFLSVEHLDVGEYPPPDDEIDQLGATPKLPALRGPVSDSVAIGPDLTDQ